MKININLQSVIIVALAITLIFSMVKCNGYKGSSAESSAYADSLVAQHRRAINDSIISKLISIEKRNKVIDSLSGIVLTIEEKRKKDNKYYQHELQKLRQVNTYTKRMEYADSLAKYLRPQ